LAELISADMLRHAAVHVVNAQFEHTSCAGDLKFETRASQTDIFANGTTASSMQVQWLCCHVVLYRWNGPPLTYIFSVWYS